MRYVRQNSAVRNVCIFYSFFNNRFLYHKKTVYANITLEVNAVEFIVHQSVSKWLKKLRYGRILFESDSCCGEKVQKE